MGNINVDHTRHKKISGNPALKLSTVKIHEVLLDKFKIESVRSHLTLQSLVNRSINLYLNDTNFRNIINTHTALLNSGSL
jgi:hypothetical protein